MLEYLRVSVDTTRTFIRAYGNMVKEAEPTTIEEGVLSY